MILSATFLFNFVLDTSQSLHLEAIMKCSEWQLRSSKMKSSKGSMKQDKLETSLDRSGRRDYGRKYGKFIKYGNIAGFTENSK